MLHRDQKTKRQFRQLMDAGLVILAFWLAHWIRNQVADGLTVFGYNILFDARNRFPSYDWLYLVIGFLSPLVLDAQGFYKRHATASRRSMTWILGKSCLILVVAVVVILFISRISTPRGVIVIFGSLAFALIYLKEELVRYGYKSEFGKNQFRKRLVLLGSNEDTDRLRKEIKRKSNSETDVLGTFDLSETSLEDLLNFLHEHSINGVVVNARHAVFGHVEKAILACELEGIETWLIADFFKTQISRTSFDAFCDHPILVFHSGPENAGQALVKQVFDLMGAILLLTVLLIPMSAVALIIRLTSPGPIFFKQKRSGLNGQPFMMYKFRSMVSDAEQRQHEFEALNEMSGPVFKVTNDPRTTWLGHWLRKFSIDELPQLINVMRGEMSLVGPRPLPVDEVKRFDDFSHRRRLSVKPGLTCLWQISGRNNLTNFKEWVKLDLEYIDNWSIWLDLKILLLTVPVVLFARGAK